MPPHSTDKQSETPIDTFRPQKVSAWCFQFAKLLNSFEKLGLQMDVKRTEGAGAIENQHCDLSYKYSCLMSLFVYKH